nr:hypothetical protein [uncultured Emticicia sp.]
MAIGAFIVSQNPSDSRDIYFQITSEVAEIPEDQQAFSEEVHRTLTVIQGLFPEGEHKFLGYYNSLLSLCQFAVVGPSAQPSYGLRALAIYQADVVAREGGRIKNNYMKKLGLWAAYMTIPSILVAYLYLEYNMIDLVTTCFFVLWGGCMAGVWLSFGSRKTIIKFESLHILEEDRLEPVIRLIFAGFLTITLALLFVTNVLNITIGNLLTSNINKDLKVALVIGIFCGLSEQVLSSAVTTQASKFFKFD